MAKVDATRNYGAETVLAGAMFDEALAEATAHAEETGATFVHAFEDPLVIAGQGTIGLELAEQVPDAKTFVLPIGGGGLAAGIAIALRALRPGVRLVGVQAGRRGRGTIADGIARQAPGRADDVDPRRAARRHRPRRGRRDRRGDHAAARARRSSSSKAPAPPRSPRCSPGRPAASGDVCALLSGGNIDATLLISVVRHGLTRAGRYLVVRTRVADRPGELVEAARARRGRARQRRSRSTTTARGSASTSPRPRSS